MTYKRKDKAFAAMIAARADKLGYIGHLGRQDHDDTLAEYAEQMIVPRVSWIERLKEWIGL